MARHVEIDMDDFGTATSPGSLETHGLATCIGVAIRHEKRGFILHASSIVMAPGLVADRFFALLDKHIPALVRGEIVPVVAGGCVDRYTGNPRDEETRDAVRADQTEILQRLKDAGFASPKTATTNYGALTSSLECRRRVSEISPVPSGFVLPNGQITPIYANLQ